MTQKKKRNIHILQTALMDISRMLLEMIHRGRQIVKQWMTSLNAKDLNDIDILFGPPDFNI